MAVYKYAAARRQAEQRVRNPRARDVPDFRRLRCVPLLRADYRRHTGQGAGLCALVGGADIAIAGRSATFALTEMPRHCPTLALSALSHVAPKTLMDMVLTVEEHDAEHALASGIVSRLADDSELESTAARILETLGGFDKTKLRPVSALSSAG